MIYLDTCIVIYLVEHHPLYFPKLKTLLHGTSAVALSPLVEMEALIHPLRNRDSALEHAYQSFFHCCTILEMPNEVYLKAARLRAECGLKTPDALHLATADWHGCSALWTNDERFAAVKPSITRNVLADA